MRAGVPADAAAVRAAHAPEKAAQAQALLRLIGALGLGRSAGRREVAALAAQGMTGRQIAKKPGVSGQAISKGAWSFSSCRGRVSASGRAAQALEGLPPQDEGAGRAVV